MSQKNVALVEAQKDSLLSISLILKFSGFNVKLYRSLDEAWSSLSTDEMTSVSCKLLLTDITFSSLKVSRNLEARKEPAQSFPVYIISDSVNGNIREEMEANNFFLIEKPVEPIEFLRRIHKAF